MIRKIKNKKNIVAIQRKLMEKFKRNEGDIDAFLITSDINRLWYSRFNSSAGMIIVTKDKSIMIVDGRYFEEATNFDYIVNIDEVRLIDNYYLSVKEITKTLNLSRVGVESDTISFASIKKLSKIVDNATIIPINISDVRMQKTNYEIKCIKQSVQILDLTFAYIFKQIIPGMTEIDVANMINTKMKLLGSEENAFNTIVASGPNSAFPHHNPNFRKIIEGDLVLIDIGAKYKGFCSDMTRTVAVKSLTPELKRIYRIVERAQKHTIRNLQLGMFFWQIDNYTRGCINTKRYLKEFCHGTGHGLGLLVHEEPYLNLSKTLKNVVVKERIVFTIEPGIYLLNKGGVRIEDDIYIIGKKTFVLGKTSRKLQILNN